MRLVQVTIPAGTRETVLEALDEEGIDYVVTDETSGREYTAVVYFPLPTNAVEPILDELQGIGLEEQSYTVVIDAETVVSRQFDDLQERYATDDTEEDRISRQELRTEATELTPSIPVYATMTVISALVATAGLLLDSAAVVVGSMVIAPLIGPALAASVGTVINDRDLFRQGIAYQAAGVVLAIGSAAVFAWLLKTLGVVPPGTEIAAIGEVSKRFTPGLLLLVVALGAGVAGVLSLSTGISVALVGVMIAAALIPPAAAAGVAIAWGLLLPAVGATVLVLVNVVSVNLAGLVTLWYTGYRPRNWFETDEAKRQFRRNVAAFVIAVAVLSVFLGGVTYSSYQTSTLEAGIETDVEGVLAQEAYEEFTLLDIRMQLESGATYERTNRVGITGDIETVIVTVGKPPGVETGTDELADALHQRIEERADGGISVQVRFVGIERR